MEPLSVTEITLAIKNCLEPAFSSLQIRGEVSNFKQQSSGHLYFSLKDAGAQIGCVMFAKEAAKIARLPKEGDQLVIEGSLSLYPPQGKYQIVVRTLTPIGLGELLLKLEALKREIKQRGWFDAQHKKPLPHLPKRIGIVTSPTGAAIQDILHVLGRRFSGVEILLNPVKVQGEGAAVEIAKAIDDFNRFKLADVLIVGRGGGSFEDLFCFNEEIVAKAIFESKIPIICAVGHETDHCIAEYVADLRAPTPSAAAEMVIREKSELQRRLSDLKQHLIRSLLRLTERERTRLRAIQKQPALLLPYSWLGPRMQLLDDQKELLKQTLFQLLQRKKIQWNAYKKQLPLLSPKQKLFDKQKELLRFQKMHESALRILSQKRTLLKNISDLLQALDPREVLKKGYSLLFDENKNLIRTVNSLIPHQSVTLLLSDGEARAEIQEISHGK